MHAINYYPSLLLTYLAGFPFGHRLIISWKCYQHSRQSWITCCPRLQLQYRLYIQQTYPKDISDLSEISLWLCAACLTDKQASLTGATRSSNKSCLCIWICQSSKNNSLHHRYGPQYLCSPLCYLYCFYAHFICVHVCVCPLGFVYVNLHYT